MTELRVTQPVDPQYDQDCASMHIEDVALREVILPATARQKARRAIAVTVYGRNLRAVAQPLFVSVGEMPVHYLQIAPDERSVEGVLFAEPPAGALIEVRLGDQEHVRFHRPVSPDMIERMG